MAGPQELGDPLGEGALEAEAPASSCLAGNRLNLDVYPEGCRLFHKLYEKRREEVEQVEFLRLSCNEELITSTLSTIPVLKGLKSLVLKGGHTRDEIGTPQRGLVASLPQELGELSHLAHLDLGFNSFSALPPCITKLGSLRSLLVSHNSLQGLPEDFGQLSNLTFFSAMKNQLQSLPQSIGELAALETLDLSENALESLPEEIGNLHSCTELDLSGNLLTGIPSSLDSNSRPEKLQRLFLEAGEDSFTVTPEGCRVFLACGVQFCFPLGATTTSVNIHFQKHSPDPQWVKLKDHDILLSEVLELQPHGIHFQKEVLIWLPYASTQYLHDREIVIRTFSGQNWSDLRTRVEWKEKPKKHVACCSVPHFSWFLVVSRLVENECRVPQEGALLFSTVDPNIKVTFPPGVTEETRTVKLQVLPVSSEDLQEITNDPETVASPLLCLSQNSSIDFLQPVKIQLPLPPGVTGLTLDRSRVHLLHSDWNAQNWNDITSQVVLEFTHLYALFEVTHFSWYWLWCTTKTYIGGFAKYVYKRLRMYQVNFIALQRKKDPEQVLLQCVPKHKVDPVLKRLHDRYRGPEPSDMVEMVEGEQFFAAFERGISIDADRPDCTDGRISFNFFSHLKNVKEVYITSEVDRKSKSVKGQVSFYRGAVPDDIPEEVTKRRKGPDSHWLATLPIKLPKLKSQGKEQPTTPNGFSLPPLNLGNAETGYLTQANLLAIAGRVGADWPTIGLNLGLSYQEVEQIRYNYRDDLGAQVLHMLFSWAQQNEKHPDCVDKLISAMKESGRQDIADEITAIIALGRQKYRESIRRVGLDQESSTEDSAIAMV
ncbi:p53-induced death domain-containing protein 1 isoform X2 [Podarcis raffonei]|uniref:p53-induced death domain-containing protein 1 isoform X2 n=1 Tax=Podarcis raffonei TaxID=65483 RepID=UPI00232956F2|nr:p53-induced death domain-containing protein 1 isoform X2 [Podarcis raffonei]